MRDGGRIAAAIEVLGDFAARRVPLKVCLADWARGARYAGAKDRAFVSGLCLDVLRRYGTLMAASGADTPGAVALCLHALWGWPLDRVTGAYAEEPHGPGALSGEAADRIARAAAAGVSLGEDPLLDIPDMARPMWLRVFGEAAGSEALASAGRAPVDLRINSLKGPEERAAKAMASFGAAAAPHAALGLRIAAPVPEERGPALETASAYLKGWVEVQDEGSQLAALAAGPLDGAQVLDYCAGGGGKTLALAALLGNRGQVFAYDADARRMSPIFERSQRAGVRNLQVVSPSGDAARLAGLERRMDLVFLDAPCSGAGTWRRRPDTKWRLTPQQWEARLAEQDKVLAEGARYVAPGGALIYVTCSPFAEENDDRIDAFLKDHPDFAADDAGAAMVASGGLAPSVAFSGEGPLGLVRLTPARTETDGFTISRITRSRG